MLFFEHKGLYASKAEVPDGEIVDELGKAAIRRPGKDATVLALGLMVGRALDAAEELAREGIDVEVIDVRSLVPLDTQTLLTSISRTGRLFTVEENPRLLGWGAEIASIAADECFWDLDMPIRRITTPHTCPCPPRTHSRISCCLRRSWRRPWRRRCEREDMCIYGYAGSPRRPK